MPQSTYPEERKEQLADLTKEKLMDYYGLREFDIEIYLNEDHEGYIVVEVDPDAEGNSYWPEESFGDDGVVARIRDEIMREVGYPVFVPSKDPISLYLEPQAAEQ